MVDFSLNANARNDLGKGASRRLRRNADLVPAIVYGGDKAPQNIALEARELKKSAGKRSFLLPRHQAVHRRQKRRRAAESPAASPGQAGDHAR